MNIFKEATLHNVWFIILSILSVGLIVCSFFLPPTGTIDPSVIQASGELLGWGALWTVWRGITHSKKTTLQHKDTNLIIEHDDE